MLAENSSERISTLDPDGTILFINHALADLSIEEVIGTNIMSYVEEHERAAYVEALDDVYSNGVIRSLGLSAARGSWLTRLIPIKIDDFVETVLVIATDLSERDAVLLDMTMPRMSGEQTLARLRRMRPQAKVLLTSGHSEQTRGFHGHSRARKPRLSFKSRFAPQN